jgi:hypothetical protein
MGKISGLNRSNLIALKQITYFATNLEAASLFEARCEAIFGIRVHLYKMEHYAFVDEQFLEASKVMRSDKRAPTTFQ